MASPNALDRWNYCFCRSALLRLSRLVPPIFSCGHESGRELMSDSFLIVESELVCPVLDWSYGHWSVSAGVGSDFPREWG